jgi:DNA-directed RNA polymerase subunit RPC12/RpoP
MYVCDNCGKRYEREEELRFVFPAIPGLAERLDPGGIVPAGECPECGALVYLEDQPVRVLVLLSGGLVRDVLADKPGVEVAVLDQDIDGADGNQIVEVVGEVDRLHGILRAHDVTVAPALAAR